MTEILPVRGLLPVGLRDCICFDPAGEGAIPS
jgi:hypothetical protein